MPIWILELFVAVNWTFSLVVLTFSPHIQKISDVSALPALIFAAACNRIALTLQILQHALYYQTSVGYKPVQLFKDFNVGILTVFGSENYQIAMFLSLAICLFGFIVIAGLWVVCSRNDQLKAETISENEHHAKKSFKSLPYLLGLEFIFAITIIVLFGLTTFSRPLEGNELVISFTALTLNQHSVHLDLNSSLLPFLLIETAYFQIAPLICTALGIGLLLLRPVSTDKDLLALAFSQLRQYPIELLFTGSCLWLFAFGFMILNVLSPSGIVFFIGGFIFHVTAFYELLKRDIQTMMDTGQYERVTLIKKQLAWLFRLF